MTQQPQPLADRIAAAMAGHSANVSNGDGTVICNCGATVRANGAAWREHRASTVLAAVQPELDELAELRLTPRERANRHVRALLDAGDHEAACAAAETFEASEAYDLTHPRV